MKPNVPDDLRFKQNEPARPVTPKLYGTPLEEAKYDDLRDDYLHQRYTERRDVDESRQFDDDRRSR